MCYAIYQAILLQHIGFGIGWYNANVQSQRATKMARGMMDDCALYGRRASSFDVTRSVQDRLLHFRPPHVGGCRVKVSLQASSTANGSFLCIKASLTNASSELSAPRRLKRALFFRAARML